MAQQFQVLRCCVCQMFQVQQVKKTKKWNCKICNEKQSVLKVFGQGSGSDCRHHVQKLNMLVGDREQATVSVPWYSEEAEERDSKNTGAQLEENLDWQENKVSRWNKYVDKSCEEEEKILHTENILHAETQTCSFLNSIAEEPRKYQKTSLDSMNTQRAGENTVPGFGKNQRRKSFRDRQTCGNAAEKNMEIPAVEEFLVHGKNEKTKLRNVVLSNQTRSLSSETFNRSVAPAVLEYQVPQVQRSATANNEIIANLIDSPPNQQHIWRQTASVVLDKVQIYSNHNEANILPEKNKDSSILKMLSKESSAIPSVHPLAFSTAIGQNSGLFSTGEDFDDYI